MISRIFEVWATVSFENGDSIDTFDDEVYFLFEKLNSKEEVDSLLSNIYESDFRLFYSSAATEDFNFNPSNTYTISFSISSYLIDTEYCEPSFDLDIFFNVNKRLKEIHYQINSYKQSAKQEQDNYDYYLKNRPNNTVAIGNIFKRKERYLKNIEKLEKELISLKSEKNKMIREKK